MARIPEHEIERLKREIAVERLGEARRACSSSGTAKTSWGCAPSTTTGRRLVITPRRICGTASGRARRAAA